VGWAGRLETTNKRDLVESERQWGQRAICRRIRNNAIAMKPYAHYSGRAVLTLHPYFPTNCDPLTGLFIGFDVTIDTNNGYDGDCIRRFWTLYKQAAEPYKKDVWSR
jgi:hypothetical protein